MKQTRTGTRATMIIFNKILLISSLLLTIRWSNRHQVDGAPSAEIVAPSAAQEQQRLEQLQQQQHYRQQPFERQLARKLQLLGELEAANENGGYESEQEVARQQLLRLQRSTSSMGGQSAAPLAPLLPQQLASLQLLEDERLMRHQLPELIAQARNDKTIERALIKMLIQASLKPQQPQLAGSSSAPQQQAVLRSQPEVRQQQDDGGSLLANFPLVASALQLSRPSIGRSEQLVDELDGSSQPTPIVSANDWAALISPQIGYQQQQQQQQNVMDKREYIKPCSFNAVSCTKNSQRSLRKLIASS